jgi:hypothetical protein
MSTAISCRQILTSLFGTAVEQKSHYQKTIIIHTKKLNFVISVVLCSGEIRDGSYCAFMLAHVLLWHPSCLCVSKSEVCLAVRMLLLHAECSGFRP